VTKIKVGAVRWDPDTLHRHSDFAPKKEESIKPEIPDQVTKEASAEFDDNFDLADFDEVDFGNVDMDHPDEVTLSAETTNSRPGPANGASERVCPPVREELTTPSKPPAVAGTLPRVAPARPIQAAGSGPTIVPQPLPGQRTSVAPMPPSKQFLPSDLRPNTEHAGRSASPNVASQHCAAPLPGQGPSAGPASRTAAFYSARAATNIDANNNIIGTAVVNAIPKFDPRSESPSIRKTSGVDHNKSVPLKRDLTADTTPHTTHIINPQFDPGRRVGAPGSAGQFQIGRGPSTSAYRPPTRRGPEASGGSPVPGAGVGGVDRALQAARRPPLGDVSNVQHSVTAVTTDGADAKRLKLAESEHGKDPGDENNSKSTDQGA
jgi:DNA repair and recombination protein RAD52